MNGRHSHSTAAVRASLTFGLMVVVLLGIAAVVLTVRIRETSRQRRELASMRRQLREQEILHPLYRELKEAAARPVGTALPCPAKQPLARSEIIGIPDRFQRVAEQCQLKLGSVSPHLEGDGELARQLQVEVQASGNYAQLRAFLLGVMNWPSFQQVERIEIRQNRMHEEFNLSIRLSLN